MKNNWHVVPAILLTLVLFWGCAKEPDNTTNGSYVATFGNNAQQTSGSYRLEDFMWIKPGETDYLDIIEVFPTSEPVIKASRSSLEYQLADGNKIVIWFEDEPSHPLLVDKVWFLDMDADTSSLIMSRE